MGLIKNYVNNFLKQKKSQWANEVIAILEWDNDKKIINDLIKTIENQPDMGLIRKAKEILFKYYNELDDLFDEYIEKHGTDVIEDFLNDYTYEIKLTDFLVRILLFDLFNSLTEYIIENYEEQYNTHLPFDEIEALKNIRDELDNFVYQCTCGNSQFNIVCDYISIVKGEKQGQVEKINVQEITCTKCGTKVNKKHWNKILNGYFSF